MIDFTKLLRTNTEKIKKESFNQSLKCSKSKKQIHQLLITNQWMLEKGCFRDLESSKIET